jgi:3-deoxy-D-manno-octulosonic-acid transferase
LLDAIYLVLLPFVLLALLVVSRGFTKPKFRRGLASKMWSTPRRDGDARSFWVHAVSVGEVLTAVPLVERLRREFPDWDVRVSVSTFTGMDVARKRFGDLVLFYFPLDLSWIVARFFRRHRPTAIVLMELELWPNFLLSARRRGVPVLVANARITERSASRYAVGGVFSRIFNLVTSFAAQNEEYRRRFEKLGVRPGAIDVLGNLKHDREPSPVVERAPEVRSRLGWGDDPATVIVAGSTHPSEERLFCGALPRLLEHYEGLRLVVAPRHVERLNPAEIASWGTKETPRRWSDLRETLAERKVDLPPGAVLLVDTVGELELFYALADVVFVGGSLIPHGGHNLFEAARLGKPVLFGPHYGNFQEEAELLLGANAASCEPSGASLIERIDQLLASVDDRLEIGRKAREVTRSLQGATARHADWIRRHLRLYLGSGAC